MDYSYGYVHSCRKDWLTSMCGISLDEIMLTNHDIMASQRNQILSSKKKEIK